MSADTCQVCGTQGGFANVVRVQGGLAECDWCAAGARVSQ